MRLPRIASRIRLRRDRRRALRGRYADEGLFTRLGHRDGPQGYDRYANLRPEQTESNMDVYDSQRIMPADANRPRRQSYRLWHIVAAVCAGLTALTVELVFSFGEYMVLSFLHRHDPVTVSAFACLGWTGPVDLLKLLLVALAGLGCYAVVRIIADRRVTAYNRSRTDEDLSQRADSSHIQWPREIAGRYSPFPDAGAHSGVVANGIISHLMLTNGGLKRVDQTLFRKEDKAAPDGTIVAYRGEPLHGKDGRLRTRSLPVIDTAFGDEVWDASGLPSDPDLRIRFDPRELPYGRGVPGDPDAGRPATWADLINAEWTYPPYEVQRPAGAYAVSSDPINTLLLAMTRAGKGQTYIEPMIDIWSREKHHRNMLINDPKGELLAKFYVPLARRGFDVEAFNLMIPQKTAIYNPIWMAADAARKGSIQQCASYITSIANTFFPVGGKDGAGDDPMWPNAAANAFKRTCYGLIDYYMEEEDELNERIHEEHRPLADAADDLDLMWSHLSLYNCYEFFTKLASSKMTNPIIALDKERGKQGDKPPETPEEDAEVARMYAEAKARSVFWENAQSADMLTLYCNATRMLPVNSVRQEMLNADSSLRAMAGSDKTIASVYGIALTAMNFFTDPTISTLTSGRPSQTLDLASLSFPRRISVRLDKDYIRQNGLGGMQAVWQVYEDRDFTRPIPGDDFHHEDTLDPEGWTRALLKGVFPRDYAYLKLTIQDPSPIRPLVLDTFRFQFRKSYRRTFDGTRIMTDPVTGRTIPEGGRLVELVEAPKGSKYRYVVGERTFPARRIHVDSAGGFSVPRTLADADRYGAIIATDVAYAEQQKAIFVVTPPHLKSYAKLILVLIRQIFDLNVEKSYVAKETQKPLYTTSYMLDEAGNLESDGHGIEGFQTMLSIGLGQSQQFTIVLQTLQQLKDVYGDSVDKIVEANVSNIVYLKGNDAAHGGMLETLALTSGSTDRVYTSSKSLTEDPKAILAVNRTTVSGMSMQSKTEDLISVNNLLRLARNNSVVFVAGQPPIWNRNETIMPMSWKLLGRTIVQPGRHYTLQTLPTLSTAQYFDRDANVPDFMAMFNKRLDLAMHVKQATETYRNAYHLQEGEPSPQSKDDEAREIMSLARVYADRDALDRELRDDKRRGQDGGAGGDGQGGDGRQYEEPDLGGISENTEFTSVVAAGERTQRRAGERRFADGTVSPDMLATPHDEDGRVVWRASGELREPIRYAVSATMPSLLRDEAHFTLVDGNLCSSDSGHTVYVIVTDARAQFRQLQEEGRIGPDEEPPEEDSYQVTDDFLIWLARQDDWYQVGEARQFEHAVAKEVRLYEDR